MIEYFTENLWQMWALLAAIGLILELTSGDFFVICFSIGAVTGAIASPFVGVNWQIGVFLAVSLLCIWQVRPFALRYLHKGDQSYVENTEAIIGKAGKVSENIPPNGSGRVAVGGEDWKAISQNGIEIPKGSAVRVVERRSITLVVALIN